MTIPTLTGYPDTPTTCRVWCRWCCTWHIHGQEDPDEIRHRVAHCGQHSPYWHSSYHMRGTATPWDQVRRTIRTASIAQQNVISRGETTPAIDRLRAQPDPEP